jgi:hypothetical protein
MNKSVSYPPRANDILLILQEIKAENTWVIQDF